MDAIAEAVIDPAYHEVNSMAVAEKCEREGLILSLPAANELQLDLDDEGSHERFMLSWEILARELGLDPTGYRMTKSRRKERGLHVRIELPFDVTPWQRIALQAALGSDPVREVLSCIRLMAGDPNPTLLIEAPDWRP